MPFDTMGTAHNAERVHERSVVSALSKRFLILLAAVSPLFAQPVQVVVDNVTDLQTCVNRPPGKPLVCALRASNMPYTLPESMIRIRRPDTTVEGLAEPGQDPPTLKRTGGDLKKMIWVEKMASNVTIRNLQIDGNKAIAPEAGFVDISVEGANATVEHVYFGNSTYYCLFIGGPNMSIHDNVFGGFLVHGDVRVAPGVNTAIKAWGPNAHQFTIKDNKISNYRCAMSITDAPGGADPVNASVITDNKLYHDSVCVPDCGGGQVYVAGTTSNVKITDNTINGGWAESDNRDHVHSYGIEIDHDVSYIYTSGNQIYNNSISGIWIGNGANHITIENETVHSNGLNGVQIGGNGRLAPVSEVSIIGLKARGNDRQRSPAAPYPTLPRFWAVMIQNGHGKGGVCIQNDSDLGENAKGAIYSDSRSSYAKSDSCPRPYN